MKNKYTTLTLLCIFVICLALLPTIVSSQFCDIDEPLAITYSRSIDIPLEMTGIGNIDCWYTLNGGVSNTTIVCNEDILFDLDRDGNYTLDLYCFNSMVINTDSVNFTVDRSNDWGTIPLFYGLLMFFFLAIAFFTLSITHIYSDEYQVIKGFLIIVSLTAAVFSIILIGFGVREYLALPQVEEIINYFYMLIIVVFVVLFYYNAVLLIKKGLENIRNRGK